MIKGAKNIATDRTGEENINNQGLKMWIKNYRKSCDIDIQFEDGYISYHKNYDSFKKGQTLNSNFKKVGYEGIGLIDRTGDINYNNQGLKMKIKEYRKCHDIDVEFEDGYIAYNKTYDAFKKGLMVNKNFKRTKTSTNIVIAQERLGEINYNTSGEKMTIIKYNNASDIVVKFDNGYITKSQYNQFKIKQIKSPYDKSVVGTGYLGEGEYKVSINGEDTKAYIHWSSMLKRCYSKDFQKDNTSYIGCTVCSEWHNFQNFAKWCYENIYKIDGEQMQLDKDILHKGNKIYSPETCLIVPARINELFIKNNNHRGQYPIGVSYNTASHKFRIKQNTLYGKTYFGSFNTPEEAFEKYKNKKEIYIKDIADGYINSIPVKLYNAMYNWKVEITD